MRAEPHPDGDIEPQLANCLDAPHAKAGSIAQQRAATRHSPEQGENTRHHEDGALSIARKP